jgi:hypothetical protein
MPTAPGECTHDKSECRITVTYTAMLTVANPPVYNGAGAMLPPTAGPRSTQSCLCLTCGLAWTEENDGALPSPTIIHSRVEQTR